MFLRKIEVEQLSYFDSWGRTSSTHRFLLHLDASINNTPVTGGNATLEYQGQRMDDSQSPAIGNVHLLLYRENVCVDNAAHPLKLEKKNLGDKIITIPTLRLRCKR